MTIAGLSAHVEAVLTALLTDHHVNSWKVVGEGQDTVFVLHVNSSQQDYQDAAISLRRQASGGRNMQRTSALTDKKQKTDRDKDR